MKSGAAMVAPAAIRTLALNVVVRPTTARPAAAAARTPESESSKATERAASAPVRSSSLKIRERIGLGPRQFGADHNDRQPLAEPERRENLLGVGARRIGDHGAFEPVTVGKVQKRDSARDGFNLVETVAIVFFLGVDGSGLLHWREVRQERLCDHGVRSAHDFRRILGFAKFDPVAREGALERGEMLRVAVNEGAVQVKEKRGAARHIVAPICQGVNSASP